MANENTPENVAATATVTADLPNRGPVLLGTFGTSDAPEALVRLPGGRISTVTTGDRIGGDRVIAIEDGRLAIDDRGRARWLDVPG
ncbi:amidophosphoribosyltransferase [Aestuariicoccus sp. MJ-SS9]|uniref:amidophosphoribosyltransferase n=1 Tax=Aestuariicoccus sp. MJ-SS9 TaxID=3079855 RepID=UPI0029083888|nr:amidophosphoribosyltransferase [Aestuariicoccus sp. MJ-SS9]MDU8911251.1 amidophosphoribosyltransferase [Aestuariicoccus sp. MJ-SS9]